MSVDPERLDAFVGRFATDLGAVLHAATVLVGDQLGLYRAMRDSEPVTADELASRTGLDARWLREWLSAQAVSGYVEYRPETDQFRLPEEQAFALTDEFNPLFVPGGLQVAASTIKDVRRLVDGLRNGHGWDWNAHDPDLFDGTERFFRPNYIGNLVEAWIPALDGMQQRLAEGARVADIGCGHGASTILLAEAYPESTFVGYDRHPESIEAARKRAASAGVADRVRFEVASATNFEGRGFALACFFDCFHDLGDPAGAAAHVQRSLADDGLVMLVEPIAGDSLAENDNPVGRIFYSVSSTVCVPASQAQAVGTALGAQAGESRLREVLEAGGLRNVRRVASTPFNMVLEARR